MIISELGGYECDAPGENVLHSDNTWFSLGEARTAFINISKPQRIAGGK